jgi:DnaJ homolog subfamily B member 4
VFIIATKPHERFTREVNDLVYQVTVSLKQALTGVETVIQTLDGRRIKVREPFLSDSSHITRVTGEGMPSQKNKSIKGDLIVKYNIKLPVAGADRQRIAQTIDSA